VPDWSWSRRLRLNIMGPYWAGAAVAVTKDPRSDSARTFEGLQALLLSLSDVSVFLQDVAELAAGVVDPPASCGITTRDHGQAFTVASSDERATSLDETQYAEGDGPCLQALRTGHPVVISDVEAENRWPAYVTRAREAGLKCSLSLPLTVSGETLGAMNIYGFDRPHSLDGEQRQRLEVFAGQASGALRLATRHAADAQLREQLEAAIGSRTVIDQAMGILMGQERCTAEAAFTLLRTHSQNSQRKIRDIATDLVQRVSGVEPQPGKPFDT